MIAYRVTRNGGEPATHHPTKADARTWIRENKSAYSGADTWEIDKIVARNRDELCHELDTALGYGDV